MLNDFKIRAQSGKEFDVRIVDDRPCSNNKRLDVDIHNGNAVWICDKRDRDYYNSDSKLIRMIHDYCTSNIKWITSRLRAGYKNQSFTPNNVIDYLGKPCTLTINNDKTKAEFSQFETRQGYKRIYAPAKNFDQHVKTFLRSEAKRVFTEYCDGFVDTLTDIWSNAGLSKAGVYTYALHRRYDKVTYSNVGLLPSNAKHWGDCSVNMGNHKNREVRFDWRLISVAREHIEYLAAHEMAHLLEQNHEDKFWRIATNLLDRSSKEADSVFDGAVMQVKRYGVASPFVWNTKLSKANYLSD